MRTDQPRSPEFEAALDAANRDPEEPQPLCIDKPEYTLYDTPPDEATTKEMCAPCPLLAMCKLSARKHELPSHGIQGGIAWQDGKQYHWLLRFGLLGEPEIASK